MLRAVFLDFDDTLHDFASAYATALEVAVAPLCTGAPGAPTPQQVRLACEEPWRGIWDRYMARAIDEDGLWTERSTVAMAAAGVDPDPERLAEMRRRYLAAMEDGLRLFPDALPALEALATARPRPVLGLLTNGPSDTQRARLRRLGLQDRFDMILISGDLGCSKPDPTFFAEALRRAGDTAAGEAVMIGDNPVADVAGAKSAGLGAVWVNRTALPWPQDLLQRPDVTVTDLAPAVRWVMQRI